MPTQPLWRDEVKRVSNALENDSFGWNDGRHLGPMHVENDGPRLALMQVIPQPSQLALERVDAFADAAVASCSGLEST